MNVIAFDLSLTCCGWASTREGSGTFKPKGKGAPRLLDAAAHVATLVYRCDLVLIEGYSYSSRASRAHSIGELGGVVRAHLHTMGIPVVEIPPSNLKKFATGKGNAKKDLVLVEAVKRLGYEGSSNDEADALWMLNMARVHYGLDGAPEMPKTHLAALEKIQWPKMPAREAT
jgi:crossover junction endodeoxyribonuclease RuvC